MNFPTMHKRLVLICDSFSFDCLFDQSQNHLTNKVSLSLHLAQTPVLTAEMQNTKHLFLFHGKKKSLVLKFRMVSIF